VAILFPSPSPALPPALYRLRYRRGDRRYRKREVGHADRGPGRPIILTLGNLNVLASGAHDLTLPVLWATTTDAGGRFGGTAAGFVNLASSLSAMLAPLSAALLERMFGSFHAAFFVAAAMYLLGAVLWLIIDPAKIVIRVKDPHDP